MSNKGSESLITSNFDSGEISLPGSYFAESTEVATTGIWPQDASVSSKAVKRSTRLPPPPIRKPPGRRLVERGEKVPPVPPPFPGIFETVQQQTRTPLPPPPRRSDDYHTRQNERSRVAPVPPPFPVRSILADVDNTNRADQITRRNPVSEPSVYEKLIGAVVHNRKRLVEGQVAVLNDQRTLQYQLLTLQTTYDDLQRQINLSCAEILASNVSEGTKALIRDPLSKFQQLSKVIDQWRCQLGQADRSVLKLQSQLIQPEEQLYQGLSGAASVSLLDQLSNGFTARNIKRPPSSATTSSSANNAASIQGRYARKIGAIYLLRDHMFNLQSEYRLGVADRMGEESSGTVVGSSDADFRARISQERHDLQQEYYATFTDMDTLKQQCRDQGYLVDSPNLPPLLDELFGDDEAFFRDVGDVYVGQLSGNDKDQIHRWNQGVETPIFLEGEGNTRISSLVTMPTEPTTQYVDGGDQATTPSQYTPA